LLERHPDPIRKLGLREPALQPARANPPPDFRVTIIRSPRTYVFVDCLGLFHFLSSILLSFVAVWRGQPESPHRDSCYLHAIRNNHNASRLGNAHNWAQCRFHVVCRIVNRHAWLPATSGRSECWEIA
jgi:hypothetical protein